MPCKQWRDEWVAHLYGELSSEERATIDSHLAGCPACSGTMRTLADSRRLLGESAPAVPAAPHVVVLRPGSRWSPAWAFASGLAAATLVFFIGTLAVSQGPRPTQALQARVAELEESPRPIQARPASSDVVTREQFDHELELVTRRFRRQRAEDLDYLARWLSASEQRTGTFMDRTQEAITYLALRGDPRLSER